MNYICQKNLTLFGTAYQPGDIIPDEAVLGSRVRSLMTCGYIAIAPASDSVADADGDKSPKFAAKDTESHSHTTKAVNKAHAASKRSTTGDKE